MKHNRMQLTYRYLTVVTVVTVYTVGTVGRNIVMEAVKGKLSFMREVKANWGIL